jgi:tetratricopeptide (TPR) repeat protein
MTPARLQTIKEIFHAALDSELGQLGVFLDKSCGGDEVLRHEVEALLASHQQAGGFIENPVVALTASIVENEQTDFLIGQKIGHYKISKWIGAGGMGAVYLAERADQQYEKRVAIKLIKRGMDSDSVLRHFRNERQILASFDHPNIARLFDGGVTESGLPYFVMEYVDGLPIDRYCDRHALSTIERLKLFRKVCSAVSYAHHHAVIHRDIKPSNILVTSDGTPKLLDFGIAKILQPEGEAEALATITGLHLMTPEYASPEQVRGQTVTTATDVYSMGVVLYQLLAGQKPYRLKTRTPEEISRAILEQELQRPSSVAATPSSSPLSQRRRRRRRNELRGDLDNIALMALRKEPERRYQSVEQFSEDIRRHLEERPVLARKDTMDYRAAKFARRNKTALAAAALVLFILVGGIIATSREAQIATREKARAERRFNDVRKLANNVLFDYHDAIKALPGATKVRERLLNDALNYLDSLAGEAHGDAALQRELAAAYERVGDVRGGESSGSLGDMAGALESYTKALRIREAVVAANPNDAQALRDVAGSHQKIGYRLLDTGERGTGEDHLQKALTLYLDLTREQLANNDLQLELSQTRNQLGTAMEGRGDFAGELEQYRAALAICEKLVASNPRDQRYRRELWSSQAKTGYALWLQNDIAGAIEANSKARSLGEALLAENPLNADYHRYLVVNYQHAGDFRKESDKRGALEYFQKAAALDEELLVADPGNALTRKDLAYTHKRIADFLVELEDNSQALLHFGKALEGYEKVVSDAPADLISQFLVATCHGGVARMQARLGEVDSSLEECRKAIVRLREITGDTKHIGRAQAYEYLGYAYVALAASPKASADEKRQRMGAARDMFQQTQNILDDLRGQGSLGSNEQWAREIAGEIAKCDAALTK